MTFVDSNILLDLFTADARWSAWSQGQLERLAAEGSLVVNDIVYAEVSVRFASVEAVEDAIRRAELSVEPIPRQALYNAGKAFRRYRAAGGSRTGVLPDFFIGAHAEAAGLRLLTRDASRYRTYFRRSN